MDNETTQAKHDRETAGFRNAAFHRQNSGAFKRMCFASLQWQLRHATKPAELAPLSLEDSEG
jgi:hypothetical protein